MTQPSDQNGRGVSGPNGARRAGSEVEHPMSLLLFAPFRSPGAQTSILVFLVIVCAGLGVAGFFVEPGHHFSLEKIPVFYGVFGFLAFAFAVLTGWPLGKLLRRDENYYDTEETDNEGGPQ